MLACSTPSCPFLTNFADVLKGGPTAEASSRFLNVSASSLNRSKERPIAAVAVSANTYESICAVTVTTSWGLGFMLNS